MAEDRDATEEELLAIQERMNAHAALLEANPILMRGRESFLLAAMRIIAKD